MSSVPVKLLCTVRNCRSPLERETVRFVCANDHSFDVARSGYVNLLQPQDRRSRSPGDTAAAVTARMRLPDSQLFVDEIVRALPLTGAAALLDAGCGDGRHLAAFRAASGAECCGVDISVAAIEQAARRDRDCQWVVANADRLIPCADASFDAVTSITARLNPDEFRRILRPGGRLLIVIAGADDLVELRGMTRDRVERTIAMFAPQFVLERHEHLRRVEELDAPAVADVLLASYRRPRETRGMAVTFSRDLLLFRLNPPSHSV